MNANDFISASIVSYNGSEKVEKICRQILEYTVKYPVKLYVIDNNSDDDTVRCISKIDGLTLITNNRNVGFGAAHNQVLKRDIGKYHFVINPDIEIDCDILSQMADFMDENIEIAMTMPKIMNPDNTEQKLPKERPTFKKLFLGRLSGFGGVFKNIRDSYIWADKEMTDIADIRFCSGCFFCIRGDIFKQLKGFDDRFFMYLEDADLTIRALDYGRVVIAPQFSVTHLWERESAKSIKYLLIHIVSSFKFLHKWRKTAK